MASIRHQAPHGKPRAQRQLERDQPAQRVADQRQPVRASGDDLGGQARLDGIDERGERGLGVRATAARAQRRRRRLAEAGEIDGEQRVARGERRPAREPDRRRVPAPVQQYDRLDVGAAGHGATAQQTDRAAAGNASGVGGSAAGAHRGRRHVGLDAHAAGCIARELGEHRRLDRSGLRVEGRRAAGAAAHAARPGSGDLYGAMRVGSPKPL